MPSDGPRRPGSASGASDKLFEKLDHEPGRLGASSATTSPASATAPPPSHPGSGDVEPGLHSSQDARNGHARGDSSHNYLVGWDAHDGRNPRNWSTRYKGFITFQLGMLALSASLGSSIIAPAESALASTFGVSGEVTVLAVSLYVLGFAFGPLLWAPVSEVYGRKVSMLPPLVALALCSIGTAVARNAATVFVTRFFGGVFGSAPVSNVSAALGDLYEPKARGVAVTFYAVCVVGGPTIGPVIGSALTVNPHLGWRWTEYIEAIWVATVTVTAFFLMPELYGPVLLKQKAQRKRKESGDDRWYHPHEQAKIRPSNILTKHVSRPLKMFLVEPMVTSIAIYASFVYALLYMTLEVFPFVYGREGVLAHPYHFSPVVSTLPFLALFVGVLAAMIINLLNQPRYARAVAKTKGRAVPEARLPPMLIGGALFVIGLFWFGWTANNKYNWAVPTVATAFIGAGFNVIFQQCINFLVDTYALYAASAVSANTFLRSIFAAGLPLAARPMFHNLGVGPACSILGGVACLALPVPLLFMRYGVRLRRMSKFAPVEE
ncbi:MFS general substrate transporter [Teratosphaeria nubilosa]|uniref:Cercosporin MFS transporter CTB4 n=1 Tax=Teratosphaeria nubilosa TaxID=161662 RepID=A0A6G1LHB4_9PEZI|nr:MFS general substrate transporter [Teratosphaeria nubilosa]